MSEASWFVVGPPRSGFTLLLSVLTLLRRGQGMERSALQQIADPYIAIAGDYLDARLRAWGQARVGRENFFYNKEFSHLIGGPKWLAAEANTLCVRKYLGIRGGGDCTFILFLPKWVLAFDPIIHSHSHPARWVCGPDALPGRGFASIRHPVDILHSSVFSINALASEYIQRELPSADEQRLRHELALSKLTDVRILGDLIRYLKNYLDEFIAVKDRYHYVMRWEDLIRRPVTEIRRIAGAAGRSVSEAQAQAIWRQLDHRNLTRYHRHSFRRGRLHDWRNSITNTHIEYFKAAGFDDSLRCFGYAPLQAFNTADYTADQRHIESLLRRGTPYQTSLDDNFCTFAANKTNVLPAAETGVPSIPRQGGMAIERSSLRDPTLARDLVTNLAAVTADVFAYLAALYPAVQAAAVGHWAELTHLSCKYKSIFQSGLGSAVEERFAQARRLAQPQCAAPRLLASYKNYNIVYYSKRFYAVPQGLGPMDLSAYPLDALPKAIFVAPTESEVRGRVRAVVPV